MKPIKNYDAIERNTTTEYVGKLPAGGYVCKILSAKEETNSYGTILKIAFDISEGEYAEYFDKQYKASNFEDKKWKGTLNLWEPKDDGSADDENTAKRFKSAICDIEDSNNGFHWDWDEKKLKGKTVGILFNIREYNGHQYTKAYQTATAENIRNGKFKIWQPELSSAPIQAEEVLSQIENNADDEDDDLPF